MIYFALAVTLLVFLTGYAVYLSTIKNPPCTPCFAGLTQDLETTTLTTNACNTTNITQSINGSTILFNFTVSGGCTGPPGKTANITILIKNNATNTTITESISSTGQSIFNVTVAATTTYYTQTGLQGPQGPTSTLAGPQGPQGPPGPQGVPGLIPTRTFRITGPIKQYIPVPIPAGATLLSYTIVGGGGGGGGGCGANGAGGAGGGGGSGFVSQNLFIVDPLNPPNFTVRLGMGGMGGISGIDTDNLSPDPVASDGYDGYPTILFLNGGPIDIADGGGHGFRCPPVLGQASFSGAGGNGAYGGASGGTTSSALGVGGTSQLFPDQPLFGWPYQRGGQNDGGTGAGPNGGIGGFGDIPSGRVGGGGGGGGRLPGSGGFGASFTPDRPGPNGGGENAGDGLFGGGGGGGPAFNSGRVDGVPGRGGTGYIEYIFF